MNDEGGARLEASAETLVERVQRGADDRQRNEALDELLRRFVRPVAARMAHKVAPHRRAEFLEESDRLVWERLAKFDSQRGRFQTWCHCVLIRASVDEWRKERATVAIRSLDEGLDGPNVVDDLHDSTLSAALHARLRRLRTCLQEINWTADGKGRVDQFAVLVLSLRLALARALTSAVDPSPEEADKAFDLAEHCLSWNAEVGGRSFRPDWPDVDSVWKELRRVVAERGGRVGGRELGAALDGLTGQVDLLTPDLWSQWIKRAKTEARRRVTDPQDWSELFSPLLTDRVRTADERLQ